MKASDLDAVILCGGLGTRLREETEFKPKPMVEIGGRPILWHIMHRYYRFGVRRFILCLGYKGEVIRDYFVNYRIRNFDMTVKLVSNTLEIHGDGVEDWEVVLQDTGSNNMTGSRLKQALKNVNGKHFFATYGDGLADVDIDKLWRAHDLAGRLATITAVRPSSRYGEIDIESDVVHTFSEKPQVAAGWINGGFMVFAKEAFSGVSDGPETILEVDVLPALARQRQLSAFRHEGFWQSMDTYREMIALNQAWASGNAPWR